MTLRALGLLVLPVALAGCSVLSSATRDETHDSRSFSVATLQWSGPIPSGLSVEGSRLVQDACGGARERSGEGVIRSFTPPEGSAGFVNVTSAPQAVLRVCVARADDGSLLAVEERSTPLVLEFPRLDGATLRIHVYPGDGLAQPVQAAVEAHASRHEPQ